MFGEEGTAKAKVLELRMPGSQEEQSGDGVQRERER